ncbi:MAG: hypothetical protein QOD77_526 [Thermoplasmata archaeon]|jgi:ABC-type Na+ efflux pump permease subunit|nr:hypothetical protein [Thermoplasmata archaeon]
MGAGALATLELRRLGRLARPRNAAVAVLLLALAAALATSAPGRLHPDAGLFPYEGTGPLAQAAHEDPRFRIDAPPLVRVAGEQASPTRSDGGRAAYDALRDATAAWQERRLAREADEGAAFPVQVAVVTALRTPPAAAAPPPGTTTGPAATAAPPVADQVATTSLQEDLRPSQVQAPFPLEGLLLAFAYVIPMNLLGQLQAGSLLADRTRRRGLLLLAAPFGPARLLLGRSALAVAAAALVALVATPVIGAAWWAIPAAVVIVAFPLALSTLLGLLARSERDLTFLLTGTTTLYAVFLFLPAVFTAIPEVAFLSPVSVVAAAIDGAPVPASLYLYATVPLTLATVAMAFLAIGLTREETMFSPASLTRKGVAGASALVRTRPRLVAAAALSVPFAFAAELLVLSLVIPLGLGAAFPLILVGVAAIEEMLKLGLAAAWLRNGRHPWHALWAGPGFFLGEKMALLLTWSGFGALDLGDETLQGFGVLGTPLLLLLPLAVHTLTIAVALPLRRFGWPLAFLAATTLHLAYDLAALWFGGSL